MSASTSVTISNIATRSLTPTAGTRSPKMSQTQTMLESITLSGRASRTHLQDSTATATLSPSVSVPRRAWSRSPHHTHTVSAMASITIGDSPVFPPTLTQDPSRSRDADTMSHFTDTGSWTVGATHTATVSLSPSVSAPRSAWSRSAHHTHTVTATASITIGDSPVFPPTLTQAPSRSRDADTTRTLRWSPPMPPTRSMTATFTQQRSQTVVPPPAPTELVKAPLPPETGSAMSAVAAVSSASAALDVQTTSVMATSACSRSDTTVNPDLYRSLSIFALSLSCEGIIQGNGLFLGVVTFVLLSATVVLRFSPIQPLRCTSWAAAFARVRCPSLILVAASYVMNSYAVCGVEYIRRGGGGGSEGTAAGVALWVFVIGLVISYPLLALLFGSRRYSTVEYNKDGKRWLYYAAMIALPRGYMEVKSDGSEEHLRCPAAMLSTAVGAYRKPSPLWALVASVSAISSWPCLVPSYGSPLCFSMFALSAALHFIFAIGLLALRPRRVLLVDIFHATALVINGTIVGVSAVTMRFGSEWNYEAQAASLGNVLMVLTGLRFAHTAVVGLHRPALTNRWPHLLPVLFAVNKTYMDNNTTNTTGEEGSEGTIGLASQLSAVEMTSVLDEPLVGSAEKEQEEDDGHGDADVSRAGAGGSEGKVSIPLIPQWVFIGNCLRREGKAGAEQSQGIGGGGAMLLNLDDGGGVAGRGFLSVALEVFAGEGAEADAIALSTVPSVVTEQAEASAEKLAEPDCRMAESCSSDVSLSSSSYYSSEDSFVLRLRGEGGEGCAAGTSVLDDDDDSDDFLGLLGRGRGGLYSNLPIARFAEAGVVGGVAAASNSPLLLPPDAAPLAKAKARVNALMDRGLNDRVKMEQRDRALRKAMGK